jgi:hypothetical protein
MYVSCNNAGKLSESSDPRSGYGVKINGKGHRQRQERSNGT